MNTPSIAAEESSKDLAVLLSAAPALEEPWFDAAPTSTSPRSTLPPLSVGEFLGDELADAWLR